MQESIINFKAPDIKKIGKYKTLEFLKKFAFGYVLKVEDDKKRIFSLKVYNYIENKDHFIQTT